MCIEPNTIRASVSLYLNEDSVPLVSNIKYLGIILPAGKQFDNDLNEIPHHHYCMCLTQCLSKVFKANVNMIHTSDIVKLELMESPCQSYCK